VYLLADVYSMSCWLGNVGCGERGKTELPCAGDAKEPLWDGKGQGLSCHLGNFWATCGWWRSTVETGQPEMGKLSRELNITVKVSSWI
jgi:hypothetical protein